VLPGLLLCRRSRGWDGRRNAGGRAVVAAKHAV